jgi:hypothetical protein
MNLQEQTNRIKQMMGVIKESEDKGKSITKIIKDMGLYDAMRYFGNYDLIKDYVTKEDKISYIRYKVGEIADELGSSGFAVHEVGREPILYYDSDETISQIEYFNPGFVSVDVYGGYKKETEMGGFTMNYERLPDDVFDEVFDFMVDLDIPEVNYDFYE